MIKKILLIILLCSVLFTTCGCWNYKGLDELSIVAGFSVDINENGDGYDVAFEIIDASGDIKEGVKTSIVESKGKTLFSAFKNARRKIQGELYLGDASVAVISNKLLEKEGIDTIIDPIMRERETRETIICVVSTSKTAKEILCGKMVDKGVQSFAIEKMIEGDNRFSASSYNVEFYKVNCILNCEGISLVLPTIHHAENDHKEVAEIGGLAVFQGKKIVGYLKPEESKYFLFINNSISGGSFEFNDKSGIGTSEFAMDIIQNRTKIKHSYVNNKIYIEISTETDMKLSELKKDADLLEKTVFEKIRKQAEKTLQARIISLIKKAQFDLKSDIFGFGNEIYRNDYKLWKQIKSNWNNLFETMEFKVNTKVNIVNTGSFKEHGK